MEFSRFMAVNAAALGALAFVSMGSSACRGASRPGERVPAAESHDALGPRGPYLGQKPPGTTPELFAPGIVTTGHSERSVVFSPAQDELFFELRGLGFTCVILHLKTDNGLWSRPETAAFSGVPADYDDGPFFTYDGRRLFFFSNRPAPGREDGREDGDIWMIRKENGLWSEPVHAGNTLNSAAVDEYPTLSRLNNLYFCSNRDANFDLYVSHFSEEGFSKPRRLGPPVNTAEYEGHPFIAADESYLVFSSDRPGQLGEGDLWVSFKGQDGEWREPVNLGEGVNSRFHEAAPYVSPDGRYLFFCSFRPGPRPQGRRRMSYAEMQELLDGPGNGSGDIYWVSTEIIESLRPKKGLG